MKRSITLGLLRKSKRATGLCLLAGLALGVLVLGNSANSQQIVKYNGESGASACLSIIGQGTQNYFRSTCSALAHVSFCFQSSNNNAFSCDTRTGGFDIKIGNDVPTSLPVGSYIVHYFACFDPLRPKNVRFNGHGLDGTCEKI